MTYLEVVAGAETCLFNDLVGGQRLGDGQAERPCGLEVNSKSNNAGCSIGSSPGFAPRRMRAT
jgi:hypothetical protein